MPACEPAGRFIFNLHPPTGEALFRAILVVVVVQAFLAVYTTRSGVEFVWFRILPLLLYLRLTPVYDELSTGQVNVLLAEAVLAVVVHQLALAWRWRFVFAAEAEEAPPGTAERITSARSSFRWSFVCMPVAAAAIMFVPLDVARSAADGLLAIGDTAASQAAVLVACVALSALMVRDVVRRHAAAPPPGVRERRRRALVAVKFLVAIVGVPLASWGVYAHRQTADWAIVALVVVALPALHLCKVSFRGAAIGFLAAMPVRMFVFVANSMDTRAKIVFFLLAQFGYMQAVESPTLFCLVTAWRVLVASWGAGFDPVMSGVFATIAETLGTLYFSSAQQRADAQVEEELAEAKAQSARRTAALTTAFFCT